MLKLLGLVVLILGFFSLIIHPAVGLVMMITGLLVTWKAEGAK
jgi:hypothetical protein